MDFLIIGVVAFLASGLTLYSGFGLGSVLLPAFALFFPAPVAVAATGVVHLLNGLFKGALLWRQADWIVVLRFGLPAVPAAVAGAWLLTGFGAGDQLFSWSVGGRVFGPAPAALVVGAVMVALGLLELQPWFQRLAAPPSAAPVGGLATGFLGGLTGQQGALRSMFLLRFGLDPARFIATGVMIAVLIDLSRLPVYALMAGSAAGALDARQGWLVGWAVLCAFAGAWSAVRWLKKVTIGLVREVVAAVMLAIGAALVAGLIGS
ncbi:MAG: sulfite exporter TauE/SafE family protein [Brevundimonas sp.]|nr:sulfite exporter TauE/SafE family protein [Brevundimonas sp.]